MESKYGFLYEGRSFFSRLNLKNPSYMLEVERLEPEGYVYVKGVRRNRADDVDLVGRMIQVDLGIDTEGENVPPNFFHLMRPASNSLAVFANRYCKYHAPDYSSHSEYHDGDNEILRNMSHCKSPLSEFFYSRDYLDDMFRKTGFSPSSFGRFDLTGFHTDNLEVVEYALEKFQRLGYNIKKIKE